MRLILLPLALLAACQNEDDGAALERQFKMVEARGTRGEICEASREVTAYYLREENHKEYDWWYMLTEQRCLNAKLMGWDSNPRTS